MRFGQIRSRKMTWPNSYFSGDISKTPRTPVLAKCGLAKCGLAKCGHVCVWCVFKIFGGCLQDSWASPRDWTAPPPDRPEFRFFFSLPPEISFFSSLSGRSSRGILVVFVKAGTLKCARLGSLGCHVKPRRPQSRRGGARGGRKEKNDPTPPEQP